MSRPFNRTLAMLVYRTMIELQKETDFNPTYREIAIRLNYKSYSWLHYYIDWLKANGYVKARGKQLHAIPQEVV
jgi:SOS-response transcriptional repressor LexA